MAKSENQKQKILILRDFFMNETDIDHPASATQIIEHLAKFDIPAERKSIYSDIRVLQDYGMDIELRTGRGGGYYLASKAFELPELKLLVDAVQSSKFLTEKKSRELIRKLETLSSHHEAGALQRQLTVSGRVKTMNESIYYNVDRIHDAIANDTQIRFRYFEWAVDGSRRFRDHTYLASPYALVWDDENYYLIAHSDRHGITHYRVDKMVSIEKTCRQRIFTPEAKKLDLAAYSKKVFGMFGGKEVSVKLRFHNSLAGVVIDRFGHDSMLIPDGEDHFLFTTTVADSPMFFGWIAGFGDRVQILFPQKVADDYRDMLRKTLALYE